ncbi:MAG: ABC transporter ATP-binding protein [Chthoniobacteraceae bacterium]|nr:ABC transporter ATP-binding protein [Chthoniobacteraceae bacterium]
MDDALTLQFTKTFRGGPEIAVDLRIAMGTPGVTVLFGPSGSGKTTLLRVLAGLDRPAEGTIRFGGETWTDTARGIYVTPQHRRVGLLFQDYALFPHLTVERNIRHGLRSLPGSEAGHRVAKLLDRLKLDGLANRFPHQLSGGQKQRVALARTLAMQPRLLMLDEPLSALDAPTRETVRGELADLLRSLQIPVLLVTHDRVEALALGDGLAIMDEGRVWQHGPVEEVFRQPANENVARIVGVDTVVAGRVLHIADGMATLAVGNARLNASAASLQPDETEVFACIRAEDVILFKGSELPQASPRNRLPGVIKSLAREGPMLRIKLDCGFALAALLTRQACEELALKEGDPIVAMVKAPNVHLVPREVRHGVRD